MAALGWTSAGWIPPSGGESVAYSFIYIYGGCLFWWEYISCYLLYLNLWRMIVEREYISGLFIYLYLWWMPVGMRVMSCLFMPVGVRIYQLPIHLFISMVDDCRELVYQSTIYLCISMVDALISLQCSVVLTRTRSTKTFLV